MTAKIWHMRILSVCNNLFLLLPETVKFLEKEAGSGEAAEALGAIFYYGQYGIDENDEKAFSYYA